ncbi:unnamed protein product, partial [marine sediment metagenome]
RSAFSATVPAAINTQGHDDSDFPMGYQSLDQWFLLKDATTAALLHEIDLNSDASATCQYCKSLFDDTDAIGSGAYGDSNVVMYPSHAINKVCDDVFGVATGGAGGQLHNENEEVFWVIQFGGGEGGAGGDLQAVYYYTDPLGGNFTGVGVALDMDTIDTMSFKARCAHGFFGYSSPNSPPNLNNHPDYAAMGYGNLWDVNSGTGGCFDTTTGDVHTLGNNYNCKHLDNEHSSESTDVGRYTGDDSPYDFEPWALQCLDGDTHSNVQMDDYSHTCAEATATWGN